MGSCERRWGVAGAVHFQSLSSVSEPGALAFRFYAVQP
jgi:hypothetical protein